MIRTSKTIRTIVLAGAATAFATGAFACEYKKKMNSASLDTTTVASTAQTTPAADEAATMSVASGSQTAPAETAVE